MRAGRGEAFDLFRKWLEEEALLACTLSFPFFISSFRARLRAVSEGELRLKSDDRTTELALRIEPSMEFGFGDATGAGGPDRFEGMLVVIFRAAETDEGEDDFIAFTEVVEEDS